MMPMENGEEDPHIYQVRGQHGDEIATLGDGIGDASNIGCLTEHHGVLLRRRDR